MQIIRTQLKLDEFSDYILNKPLTDNGKSFYEKAYEDRKFTLPKNHYSKINNNMYTPKRVRMYQAGGQIPQQQNPEMEMVQQILQAIQQLSPEAQQALMQQLQGGQNPQEENMEQQYTPPQQRMGGMHNKYM